MNNQQLKRVGAITIFFSIAIALRYVTNVINPNFITNLNPYVQILLQGIGPLVGGLLVVKILKRPNFLKIFGLGFTKTITIVAIPIILFAITGFLNGFSAITLAKIIGTLILYALFEEFGWRGYLQSELNDVKKFYKYMIITVLWFVWHLNFELSVENLIFFLLLFAGSYGIGYMADRSKSLVVAALFHSFLNISQTGLLSEISLSQKLLIIGVSAVSAIFIMRYKNPKTTNAAVELAV